MTKQNILFYFYFFLVIILVSSIPFELNSYFFESKNEINSVINSDYYAENITYKEFRKNKIFKKLNIKYFEYYRDFEGFYSENIIYNSENNLIKFNKIYKSNNSAYYVLNGNVNFKNNLFNFQ